MKKTLFAVVLVIAAVAVFVALPWFLGREVEARFKDAVEGLSRPGSFRVKVAEYQRGVFSSEARVEVTVEVSNLALASVFAVVPEFQKYTGYTIYNTIHHGPWPMAGTFTGEGSPFFALGVMDSAIYFKEPPFLFSNYFGDSSIATARTSIGLTGDARLRLIGTPLSYNAPDGMLLIGWKGFDGKLALEGEKITGGITGDGLDFAIEGNSFSIAPYSALFDYLLLPSGVLAGTHEIEAGGMTMVVESKKVYEIHGIKVKDTSTVEGDLLAQEHRTSVEKAEVVGSLYGPAELSFRFKNIDYRARSSLLDSLQRGAPLIQSILEQGNYFMLANFDFLDDAGKQALGAILSRSPEFEIPELSVVTPQGKLFAKVKARYNGGGETPENVLALMAELDVDWEARIPVALATEMKMKKSVYFVTEGGDYVIRGEMRKRNITVNGKNVFSM